MAVFIFNRKILESTKAAIATGIDDTGLAFLLSEEGVHEDEHAIYIDRARLQVDVSRAVILQDTTWRLAGHEHAASGFRSRMGLGYRALAFRVRRLWARLTDRTPAPRALPAQAMTRGSGKLEVLRRS